MAGRPDAGGARGARPRRSGSGGRVVRFPKVADALTRRPKVVVTGGSGFFGERLVCALLTMSSTEVRAFAFTKGSVRPMA